MKVSIIICTCNNANSLSQTLASVLKVERPAGWTCELIVVDNGSGPETAAAVRECGQPDGMPVRYLREPRKGVCFARNVGIAQAGGDIIIFTDDDVRHPRDWLAVICAPIIAGEADAVSGGVRMAPHLNKLWMKASHRAWVAGTDQLDAAKPSRMVGANMAFSRRVLEKVPAFDTELGAGSAVGLGDDTLFSLQLQKAGYRIAAVFEPPVEHHFAEKRLERAGWIRAAKIMGNVDAYLAYHWEHAAWPRPRWAAFASFVQLVRYRVLHRSECRKPNETPEGLIHALRDLHANLAYLRERKRPRNYAKDGLVKKGL